MRAVLALLLILFATFTGAPLTAAAATLTDIAYGPDPAQRLDVYGAGAAKDAPVLVMVHGGSWTYGDKAARGVVKEKAEHWLPRGYLFVSVEYRFADVVDPVEQARDVGRALAFVQKNAATWGGDPARVVLMGHSAGAHLATLLAADADLAAGTGTRLWLGTVALDSAAYDVSAIMARPHAPLYDRAFGKDPALWRRASPLLNIVGKPAPMLLVCSTLRADSCPASAAFAGALTAAGARAEVAGVPMRHMAINRELGKPGDYTARVDAFLKSLDLP